MASISERIRFNIINRKTGNRIRNQVVDSETEVRHGDIVVARIGEDEATIKRLHQTSGRMELVPENPRYPAIPLTEQTAILGKVIRVLRDYV